MAGVLLLHPEQAKLDALLEALKSLLPGDFDILTSIGDGTEIDPETRVDVAVIVAHAEDSTWARRVSNRVCALSTSLWLPAPEPRSFRAVSRSRCAASSSACALLSCASEETRWV